MTFEGLGEMFEGDSADMCAEICSLVLMGGQAEGLACADPGTTTPIGARCRRTSCSSSPHSSCDSVGGWSGSWTPRWCSHSRPPPCCQASCRESGGWGASSSGLVMSCLPFIFESVKFDAYQFAPHMTECHFQELVSLHHSLGLQRWLTRLLLAVCKAAQYLV